MTPEVSDVYMFIKTAKEIWDSYKANYSKVGDAAQIYDIKMRIFNTKQGNYSVNKYAHTLQKKLHLQMELSLQ